MSKIRCKDTKPELIVRKFLHSQGIRFRLHKKDLPGKPDIVLKKFNIVIFVHGCFWHGHKDCKYFTIPKTRTDWWKEKISLNQERDKINIRNLVKSGWKVIQIWECKLKSSNSTKTLDNLIKTIKNEL